MTDNIKDIIEDPEISIVAEFIGGEEPAKYILSALKIKTVVTANKEVMARHWGELERTAIRMGWLYLKPVLQEAFP